MDDSFFNLPFIREAQGPLAWVVTLVSVGLMLSDRLGKWGDARRKQHQAGGKENVDRFEALSEAEARLRGVYEAQNVAMRDEIKELRSENEVLRSQLTETKDALAEAQRDLRGALESIKRLETQLGTVQRNIENHS